MAQPPNPPGPTPDQVEEGEAALIEGMGLAKGVDLSSRGALRKMRQEDREDAMSTHLHRVYVLALYLVGAAIIAMVLALMWNMAAPENLRFLKPEEVKNLQSLLFSGAIGSAVTTVAKKLTKIEAAAS